MSDTIEPLIKNDYAIVKLILCDKDGTAITKPYKLELGQNTFKCIAIYNDGTSADFSPYWTCPIILTAGRSVSIDVWGVLGQRKQPTVTINAAPNHQRYTELACWVFPPKEQTHTGNAEIPHSGVGFDYSAMSP